MYKSILFFGAMFAYYIPAANSSAQECTSSGVELRPPETIYFQGYSDNLADGAGSGTSTVEVSTREFTVECDGQISKKTVTRYVYLSGPGNSSKFESMSYDDCSLIGDFFNC